MSEKLLINPVDPPGANHSTIPPGLKVRSLVFLHISSTIHTHKPGNGMGTCLGSNQRSIPFKGTVAWDLDGLFMILYYSSKVFTPPASY
jgi:hypothetical protein